MLFLDNAAPDCRVPVAHTHISTFGIYSGHGSRENVRTNPQTHKPTDYNIPSLRMRARGLMMRCTERSATWLKVASVPCPWYLSRFFHFGGLYVNMELLSNFGVTLASFTLISYVFVYSCSHWAVYR